MGFRCIKCHKDFGYDKKALDEHMKECGNIDIESLDIETLGEELSKRAVYESLVKPELEALNRTQKNMGAGK